MLYLQNARNNCAFFVFVTFIGCNGACHLQMVSKHIYRNWQVWLVSFHIVLLLLLRSFAFTSTGHTILEKLPPSNCIALKLKILWFQPKLCKFWILKVIIFLFSIVICLVKSCLFFSTFLKMVILIAFTGLHQLNSQLWISSCCFSTL